MISFNDAFFYKSCFRALYEELARMKETDLESSLPYDRPLSSASEDLEGNSPDVIIS